MGESAVVAGFMLPAFFLARFRMMEIPKGPVIL